MSQVNSRVPALDASAAAGGAGATRKLARHAATLRYEQLPPALVEITKQCIVDTLAVSIGASTLAPEARLVNEYVTRLGGTQESTILGFGGKAPAPWTVFVNGSLGHMLDYDDLGASHVSIATVPVAFAVAEKVGGVSGRDLIAAIACGTDLQTRLYHGIRIPSWTVSEGWFATQLFGFMAGAATAGRLLGLDEDRMENALGIGFNQTSGSRQMAVGTSTHMRSMQAGFSGQGGVLAAELAQMGITGPKEIVEGRYGYSRITSATPTRTGMRSSAGSVSGSRSPRRTASRCGRRARIRGRPTQRLCNCASSTTFVPTMSRASPSSAAAAATSCYRSRSSSSADPGRA